MAEPRIDVDGLPLGVSGPYDTVVGVDEATGAARRFPMPQPGTPRSYATRASLPAASGFAEGYTVWVNNDPTPANNGTWAVLGGVWVQSADRVTGLEGRVSAAEVGVSKLDAVSFVDAEPDFEQGSVDPVTGSPIASAIRIRSRLIPGSYVSVSCANTQQVALFFYSPSGVLTGSTEYVTGGASAAVASHVRVLVRKVTSSVAITPAENTAVVVVDRVAATEVKLAAAEAAVDGLQNEVLSRSQIVYEQPSGYPLRPALQSVTWIGPNEPPIQSSADEWRPTGGGGYLYTAPIWQYGIGALPSEWQRRWVIQDPWEVVQRNIGPAIFVAPTSRVRQLLAYQPADADESPDMEVVCRLMIDQTAGTSPRFFVGLRLSGEEGQENGYALAGTNPGTIQLYRYVAGAGTATGAAASAPWAVSQWFWLRFRAQGNLLRGRVWVDGTPEPSEWALEISNGSVTGAGAVGIWPGTLRFLCSYFAAASGGETAPGGT